jgi:hypothetical protein
LVRGCLLCVVRGITRYHATLQLRYQSVLVYATVLHEYWPALKQR